MERKSISKRVDGAEGKTRSKCLSKLPLSDSTSETRKIAGDPPPQIMEFQKEKARDEDDKSLIDLRKRKGKQNDMTSKAQSGGMIGQTRNPDEIPLKDYIRFKREIREREGKSAKLKERSEIENTTRTETKADCTAEDTGRTKENAKHKDKRAKLVTAGFQELSLEEGIYASELQKGYAAVENFIKQLDENVKSDVDYLDFKFLEKDLGKDWKIVGRFNVPSCLAPIADKMFHAFDRNTFDSFHSDCAATPSFVLFCAAIKEMEDMKLDQIDRTKIFLWRDAINCALNVQFKVDFAIKHLKKIARAHFGLKAMKGESSEELKNVDGTVKKKEVPEDCLREAQSFRGKPLSTGLFLEYFSN